MKIIVIEGDVSLFLILEVVNIEKVEVLLVVIGNDIINLKIVLSVKGLMLKVLVVVRN